MDGRRIRSRTLRILVLAGLIGLAGVLICVAAFYSRWSLRWPCRDVPRQLPQHRRLRLRLHRRQPPNC